MHSKNEHQCFKESRLMRRFQNKLTLKLMLTYDCRVPINQKVRRGYLLRGPQGAISADWVICGHQVHEISL